jgi:hypothetical protein
MIFSKFKNFIKHDRVFYNRNNCLFFIFGNVSKNYAFELLLFHFFSWKNSITFFDGEFAFRRKGDHSPEIRFELTILNCNLIEFSFYNVNHEKE